MNKTVGTQQAAVVEIAPGLRRVRANNPSPMTERGTNSYLLGQTDIAVIDPGPDLDSHLEALLVEIGQARVSAILVTHSHVDHSALVPKLARATGAPVYAYGDSLAGQRPEMAAFEGALGGGEGVDAAFAPDRLLKDGETLNGQGWEVQALWTPGHMGNHLCFAFGDILFSGDLVMGWATSLVSPPDGDLNAFMASCRRLQARDDRLFLPGHGDPVTDPAVRLAELLAHREERMEQLRAALKHGAGDAATLTRRVYTDIHEMLLPAAERNLLAHLLALLESGEVRCEGEIGPKAVFSPN